MSDVPIPGDRREWETMMLTPSTVCERCAKPCYRKSSGVWAHGDPRNDRHMVLLALGWDDAWNDRPGVRVSAAPPF